MARFDGPHFNAYRRRLGYVLLVGSLFLILYGLLQGWTQYWVGISGLIMGLILVIVHRKRESEELEIKPDPRD